MVIQNHTCPFSFHLIATAIMIIETEKPVGRARANLPKWSNKAKSKKAPTGITIYPHNGKRIRLSSAVITLSLAIHGNRFSCAVGASRPRAHLSLTISAQIGICVLSVSWAIRTLPKITQLARSRFLRSASPRCLDGGDVDLLHRHHDLEGTACLTRCGRLPCFRWDACSGRWPCASPLRSSRVLPGARRWRSKCPSANSHRSYAGRHRRTVHR